MDDNGRSEIYKKAMREVPRARAHIVQALHDMVAARGAYKRFTYFPPRITGVWAAAVDIIEQDARDIEALEEIVREK